MGESIGAIASVLELSDSYLFELKYDKEYFENVRQYYQFECHIMWSQFLMILILNVYIVDIITCIRNSCKIILHGAHRLQVHNISWI